MVSHGHVGASNDVQTPSLTPHRYFAVFRVFAQLNSTEASVSIHDPVLFGTPVNFDVVLDQDSLNTEEILWLVLIVKRAITVKVLVAFIVMANCTSASHYASASVFGDGRLNVASGQGLPV